MFGFQCSVVIVQASRGRESAVGSLRSSGFPARDLPFASGVSRDCGTGEGALQAVGLTRSREGKPQSVRLVCVTNCSLCFQLSRICFLWDGCHRCSLVSPGRSEDCIFLNRERHATGNDCHSCSCSYSPFSQHPAAVVPRIHCRVMAAPAGSFRNGSPKRNVPSRHALEGTQGRSSCPSSRASRSAKKTGCRIL